MNEACLKPAYVAPRLRPLGRVEAVTAGNSTGSNTDAVFTAGVTFDSVTFS